MPDLIQQIRDTYSTDKAAALNMLPELFQQYDEGLIKVLPCKVGDTIYRVNQIFGEYSISEEKFYDNNIRFNWFFGKTVFLTREAAEATLKERKP